ncbi:19094_t:CDS:1, partial [Dentiscutata erythropus]
KKISQQISKRKKTLQHHFLNPLKMNPTVSESLYNGPVLNTTEQPDPVNQCSIM